MKWLSAFAPRAHSLLRRATMSLATPGQARQSFAVTRLAVPDLSKLAGLASPRPARHRRTALRCALSGHAGLASPGRAHCAKLCPAEPSQDSLRQTRLRRAGLAQRCHDLLRTATLCGAKQRPAGLAEPGRAVLSLAQSCLAELSQPCLARLRPGSPCQVSLRQAPLRRPCAAAPHHAQPRSDELGLTLPKSKDGGRPPIDEHLHWFE